MATKTVTKRKASKPAEESSARKAKPAQESTAFGPIAERFRRAGDYERAISLCREGLQKFPNHASARVTLGWALLETGKYDEARVELEQVLRRAPDNLAAIRGLAELHDRSEHTMNLPMDGPGQWPPSAAAIDGQPADEKETDEADADDEADTIVAKARTAKPASPAPAVIAPAELGLAMWSPVDVEPAKAAAPTSTTTTTTTTTATTHSGMSSVREIDPDAVVVQAETPAEPQVVARAEPVIAAPPQTVAAEPTEAEIAALIAEADALEAAAQGQAQEFQSTIVLDSSVDLSELVDETQFVPEPFEVGGEIVARAEPEVVQQPEIVAEPAPVAEPEVVVEAAQVADPDVLIGAAQFTGPEPEVVVEAAQIVEPEPEIVVEAAQIVEPEPEIVVEPVQIVQPDVVVETPAIVEPEPEFEPLAVAAFEAVAEEPQLGTVFAMNVGMAQPRKPTLVALERLLRKVQTRRLQLVSESVA